jgi:transcriptional regulator with XRE-family HTH domain
MSFSAGSKIRTICTTCRVEKGKRVEKSAATMDSVIETITKARASLSISRRELADVVGCSEATLSNLERGIHDPSLSLISKITAALDLDHVGSVSTPRITSVAVGMRCALMEDPPDRVLAFRIMSRFTGQWRGIVKDSDKFESVSTRPISTSDLRFDAMLAGYVEHLCVVDEVTVPKWVYLDVYYLEIFWWRTELPGMRAIEMAETPGALSNRRVFTTARSLESV